MGDGAAMTSFIFPRMCSRASRAWLRALPMISRVNPVILISIWRAVIPSLVPATLKSMSPRESSSPRMSDRTATRSSSLMRPMATPATAALMGTPASIRAMDAPQIVAMEEEPLEERISDTMRMV